MRTPTPVELLAAWDAAETLRPAERLTALLCAVVDGSRDDVAQLSLGQRDRMLVELRERLFGGDISAVHDCPSCRLRLDINLATSELLATSDGPDVIEVRADGLTLTCRPLRAADLEDAAAAGSLAEARTLLIARSVLSVDGNGGSLAARELSADVVAAAASALSEADPLADVEISLACEACGAAWTASFDIASYLWEEIDACVSRILRDVDVLARAYGWSERDVLSLNPRRRLRYLELVTDG